MTKTTHYRYKRISSFRSELHHSLFHKPWSGGVVLLIFAVAAIILANLESTREFYHHFFETPITLGFGDFSVTRSLEFFINDGLMVIFFFSVGLEIKREILAGELRSMKHASLPIAAALGGMVVPALIYAAINWNSPQTMNGWGIPMATDIAFAIGILSLMGDRVPISLKVFLTALAIVDDLGAIVVIALFYPSQSGINVQMLLWALVVFGFMMMMQRGNIYKMRYYLLPSLILWVLFLNSGIHATISGVLIALTIPATPRYSKTYFRMKSRYYLSHFDFKEGSDREILGNPEQHETLQSLRRVVMDTISPAQRLEHSLTHFVTFFVMPVFALANAGITLGGAENSEAIFFTSEGIGIFLGLVIGKPLGISLFCWLLIKIGLGEMPQGATWRTLISVACLGGIGFTMSIFVTNLAFPGAYTEILSSKAAILCASTAAALIGALAIILSSKRKDPNPHRYHV